jgi:hypothetical protein
LARSVAESDATLVDTIFMDFAGERSTLAARHQALADMLAAC